MSLAKYAAAEVLLTPLGVPDARIAKVGGKLIKDAHRHEFDYDPRPGYLYVRSRAISSRCNDNFDEFPADEIKQAYATFIGKPVFVNHHNDNHRRARGVIVDAALHEDRNPDGSPDTWAEVLMEVDAVNFPKLAEAIVKGHIDRTSMGTDVKFSVCSACGNKAETPLDYCVHIPRLKGKKIVRRNAATGAQETVLIREICHGLGFFENSLLVEEPADPTAHVWGVDTRGMSPVASTGRTAARVEVSGAKTPDPPKQDRGKVGARITASSAHDEDNAYSLHRCHHTSLGRVLDSYGREAAVGDDEWEKRWNEPSEGAPVPEYMAKGAHEYRAKHNLTHMEHGGFDDIVADKDRAHELSTEYDKLPHADPKAHKAYKALANEVHQQFKHLTHRMGVHVEFTDEDPYEDHHAMAADITNNKRLKVLRTSTTEGDSGAHPMLSHRQNDEFRAVHDAFGHAATGRPFDRHGEEAAWAAHAGMFSPLARSAMTTETRGQNSSLIMNGHFPEQKAGILPKKFWSDEAVTGVKRVTKPTTARKVATDNDPDADTATASDDQPFRLYRGERPFTPGADTIYGPMSGRFFTGDKEMAKRYVGSDGHLYHVDAPPKYRYTLGMGEDVIPKALADQRVHNDDCPNCKTATFRTAGYGDRNPKPDNSGMSSNHRHASRKLGYGEVVAPPEVDTLRDDICPVCFGPETMVRTQEGYVPIASIEPGDMVLSADGKYHQVLEVMEREYDGAVYEVRSQSMPETITVTPEHPFLALASQHLNGAPTAKGKDRCRPGCCSRYGESYAVKGGRWGSGEISHQLEWVYAQNLVEGGWLATNVPQSSIDLDHIDIPSQHLTQHTAHTRSGPLGFDLNEDFLWAIGLYLAEGSSGKRTITYSLHDKEIEYAERIRNFWGGLGYGTAIFSSKNGGNGCDIEVYSTTLASWFSVWLGSGSSNKALPPELLNLPNSKRSIIFEGILDGDGHRAKDECGQTSPVLAMQLAEWAISNGVAPSVYVDFPKNKRPVYTVHNLHGRAKSHWEHQGRLLTEIIGCRLVPYAGTVYNLRVDGDPTYTVQSIAVHNCGEKDSYNGDECMVCDFHKPPQMFMDPDVDVARQIDLRQDQNENESQADTVGDTGDLLCPNCGSQFNSDDADGDGIDENPDPGDNEADAEHADDADPYNAEPAEIEPEVDPYGMQLPTDDVPGQNTPEDPEENESPFADPDDEQQAEEDDAAEDATSPQEGDTCPNCGKGELTAVDPDPDPDPSKDDEDDDDQEEDDDPDRDRKAPPFAKGSSRGRIALSTGSQDQVRDGQSNHYRRDTVEMAQQKRRVAPTKRTASAPAPRRDLHATLARMQATVQAQSLALQMQARQISRIAKLAGVENDMKAIARHYAPTFTALRKKADEENPAQPIPSPPSEPAAETTEEALAPAGRDDVMNVGASPVTDVSADAVTSVDEPFGEIANEPLDLNEQDVTAPVEGTDEMRPPDETITYHDVQVGNPDRPETSFPLQGEFAEPGRAASKGRTYAALRLAKLRLATKIATGDELSIAQSIDSSKMSDSAIASEIETIGKIVTAARNASGSAQRTAGRHLVPQSAPGAPRSAPSMSQGAVGSLTTAALVPSDDEFMFEG